MKKRLFLAVTAIFFSVAPLLQAQETPFIEVSGIAEREIDPNEIYYSVSINTEKFYEEYEYNREYDQYDPVKYREIRDKVELRANSAQKVLNDIFERLDIKDKELLDNKYSITDYDLYVADSYVVKLKDTETLDQLAAELRKSEVFQAHILRSAHTDQAQIKEDLKLEALKNAKEKAQRMAKALDASLGRVLQIRENTNDYDWTANIPESYDQSDYYGNRRRVKVSTSAKQKIQLRAQVWVRFTLI